MKQQTAMQELVEILNQVLEDNYDSYTQYALDKATELLQKEEEQIIEAYNDGEGKVIGNGQKYFNQTYKP